MRGAVFADGPVGTTAEAEVTISWSSREPRDTDDSGAKGMSDGDGRWHLEEGDGGPGQLVDADESGSGGFFREEPRPAAAKAGGNAQSSESLLYSSSQHDAHDNGRPLERDGGGGKQRGVRFDGVTLKPSGIIDALSDFSGSASDSAATSRAALKGVGGKGGPLQGKRGEGGDGKSEETGDEEDQSDQSDEENVEGVERIVSETASHVDEDEMAEAVRSGCKVRRARVVSTSPYHRRPAATAEDLADRDKGQGRTGGRKQTMANLQEMLNDVNNGDFESEFENDPKAMMRKEMNEATKEAFRLISRRPDLVQKQRAEQILKDMDDMKLRDLDSQEGGEVKRIPGSSSQPEEENSEEEFSDGIFLKHDQRRLLNLTRERLEKEEREFQSVRRRYAAGVSKDGSRLDPLYRATNSPALAYAQTVAAITSRPPPDDDLPEDARRLGAAQGRPVLMPRKSLLIGAVKAPGANSAISPDGGAMGAAPGALALMGPDMAQKLWEERQLVTAQPGDLAKYGISAGKGLVPSPSPAQAKRLEEKEELLFARNHWETTGKLPYWMPQHPQADFIESHFTKAPAIVDHNILDIENGTVQVLMPNEKEQTRRRRRPTRNMRETRGRMIKMARMGATSYHMDDMGDSKEEKGPSLLERTRRATDDRDQRREQAAAAAEAMEVGVKKKGRIKKSDLFFFGRGADETKGGRP